MSDTYAKLIARSGNRMYKNRKKKRMRRKDFSPDLFNQSTKLSWKENWLVSFNTSKSKRVTFHHQWEDLKLGPILINCQQPQRGFLSTGAKLQPQREMERVCPCHSKICCKNNLFNVSLQKISNSRRYPVSL